MNQLNILAYISRFVLTNDERAFEQIVKIYQEPLRQFFILQCNGDEFLADDLSQETFIRIWQKLNSFKQLASFSTWLFRIAYHVWMDYLRQNRELFLNISADDTSGVINETEDIMQLNALCEKNEQIRNQWITQSLMKMKEPAKTCLILFYFEEFSIQKIANITGFSVANVKNQLCRGRHKLRLIMQQNNPYK